MPKKWTRFFSFEKCFFFFFIWEMYLFFFWEMYFFFLKCIFSFDPSESSGPKNASQETHRRVPHFLHMVRMPGSTCEDLVEADHPCQPCCKVALLEEGQFFHTAPTSCSWAPCSFQLLPLNQQGPSTSLWFGLAETVLQQTCTHVPSSFEAIRSSICILTLPVVSSQHQQIFHKIKNPYLWEISILPLKNSICYDLVWFRKYHQVTISKRSADRQTA